MATKKTSGSAKKATGHRKGEQPDVAGHATSTRKTSGSAKKATGHRKGEQPDVAGHIVARGAVTRKGMSRKGGDPGLHMK